MNRYLLLLTLLLCSLPSQAAEMFLTLKTGVFELKEHKFSSSLYGQLDIDTSSMDNSAIGLEWLVREHWMLGFELYKTQHDWNTISMSGKVDGRMVLFSAKRLFNTGSFIQPYIGAGAGLVYLDFNTGDSWENEGSVASHIGGGVLFNFGEVSAYIGRRHFENLSTTADYEFAASSTYAGMSFGF